MDTTEEDYRKICQTTLDGLQGELANGGTYLTIDSRLRLEYSKLVKAASSELSDKATRGLISWEQAAAEAQEMRNAIMEMIRGRSTPLGRAMAQQLKREGKTLNALIANKTRQNFGESAIFDNLSELQKNKIYGDIVKSAGKSNPRVNAKMLYYSRAGKGLLILSLAVSVYVITTSDDKMAAVKQEAAVTGSGIVGGMAGGAVAGLVCGPGAPVCVTIGAFVGGALASMGMSLAW